MSKADKSRANNDITYAQDKSNSLYDPGVANAQNRQQDVQARSDTERANIIGGYNSLNNPTGGLTADQIGSLTPGSSNYMGTGGSHGGGVGTGVAGGYPDYLSTYNELKGSTGGFDPGTLSDLNDTIGKLKNTQGNYGATDNSISGLQKFASTGGVSADNISKIDSPTLEEFSKTGGFNADDLANVRARANSGATSTYQNLNDSLDKQRLISGQAGPGWSAAGFKLARQGAQAAGDTARNTEVDLNNAVTGNRMSAASTLADKMQNLSALQSQNTLAGYTNSGNLDETKQAQIDQAMSNSGNLDINKQGLINQTRLSAAGGLSSDYLGRASINAQSSAAQSAIDAANSRALLGYETGQRDTGLQGLLNTYGTAPAELMNDQSNTLNWTNSQVGSNQNLINSRIGVGGMSSSPDWMGTVAPILGAASGITGGLSGLGGGGGSKPSGLGVGGQATGNPLQGYYGGNPQLNMQYLPTKTQLMGYNQ